MAKRKVKVVETRVPQPVTTIVLVTLLIGFALMIAGCLIDGIKLDDQLDSLPTLYVVGACLVVIAILGGLCLAPITKVVEIEVNDNEEIVTAEH